MPEPSRNLTPKQQRFIDEYLVDLNAAAAYQRAGYATASGNSSEAAASRLLSNVKVQAEIAARQAVLSADLGLDRKWVLTRLKEEATYRGESASHSARVRASELVGKHIGMFKEQVELTGANCGPVQFVEVVRNSDDADAGGSE